MCEYCDDVVYNDETETKENKWKHQQQQIFKCIIQQLKCNLSIKYLNKMRNLRTMPEVNVSFTARHNEHHWSLAQMH